MLLNKSEIYILKHLIDDEIDWNKDLINARKYGWIEIDPDEALKEIEQFQKRINALEGIDIKLKVEKERIDRLPES